MTDQPKTWGEMTDAEKGALLLAAHEGRDVEVYCLTWGEMKWRGHEDARTFHAHMAYRIKPEPVRETVPLYGRPSNNAGSRDFFDEPDRRGDTHVITFDLIDGEPDCASIRMVKL